MDGDSDANIVHYWIHKLHKLPSEYLALPRLEKAFIIASIQVKIEAEKKAQKEAERKGKKGKGRKNR